MSHLRYKYNKAINANEFWVASKSIGEDVLYINKNDIDALVLDYTEGYKLNNLSFLQKTTKIKYLTITSDKITDFEGIKVLRNLKELYIFNTPRKYKFDFSNNRELKLLNIPSMKIYGVDNIQNLVLRNVTIRLDFFGSLNKLNSLTLIQCKGFADLTFLPSKIQLMAIDISYSGNLESIIGVDRFASSLEEISLTNCKNIKDLDLISKCRKLKSIIIDNSGALSGAYLFKGFYNLKHFVLMGKSSYFKNSDVTELHKMKITHLFVEK